MGEDEGPLGQKNKPTHSTHVALRKAASSSLTQLMESKKYLGTRRRWMVVQRCAAWLPHGAVRPLGWNAPEAPERREREVPTVPMAGGRVRLQLHELRPRPGCGMKLLPLSRSKYFFAPVVIGHVASHWERCSYSVCRQCPGSTCLLLMTELRLHAMPPNSSAGGWRAAGLQHRRSRSRRTQQWRFPVLNDWRWEWPCWRVRVSRFVWTLIPTKLEQGRH